MVDFNVTIENYVEDTTKMIKMGEMKPGQIGYAPERRGYVMRTLSSYQFEVMELNDLTCDRCWTTPMNKNDGNWGYDVEILEDATLELKLPVRPKSMMF